jgi:hypothetical protein
MIVRASPADRPLTMVLSITACNFAISRTAPKSGPEQSEPAEPEQNDRQHDSEESLPRRGSSVAPSGREVSAARPVA